MEFKTGIITENTTEHIISGIAAVDKILLIVILNPFDYNFFIKSNDLIRERNIKVIYCIAYNSKFYITNIFKKDWHNPCPKCFFSQLEASLRAKYRNSNNITFQTIIDLIYSKNIQYTPELPISNRSIVGLVQTILSFDKLDTERYANEIVEIDLNGNIRYDQAIHWELCDCIY